MDGVIRVREAFCIKKGDASFIIRRLHCKCDVGIHLVNLIEQDVLFIFLDNKDDIIQISVPPGCGDGE